MSIKRYSLSALKRGRGKIDSAAATKTVAKKNLKRDVADDFRGGVVLHHGALIGRPPKANKKRAINLRLDPDVIEGFKKTGPNWQTRMNDTLREWLAVRSII
jgi:uncharacterized protein (DUF4415 family)